MVYTRSWQLFRRVSRLVNVPVILELHMPPEERQRSTFDRFAARVDLKRLVVISRHLRDHISEFHPSLADRILLAPDAADFPPSDIEAIKLRRGDRMIAGYCGQLFKGKGAEVKGPPKRKRAPRKKKVAEAPAEEAAPEEPAKADASAEAADNDVADAPAGEGSDGPKRGGWWQRTFGE